MHLPLPYSHRVCPINLSQRHSLWDATNVCLAVGYLKQTRTVPVFVKGEMKKRLIKYRYTFQRTQRKSAVRQMILWCNLHL